MRKLGGKIGIGKYVKHIDNSINGGLEMSVEDISIVNDEIAKVLCSHFTSHEGQMKSEWFDIKDLHLY